MKHQELAKLQAQYDRLPIEEKLRRMEYLAQYYLGLLTDGAKPVVDATKHWPQFAFMQRQDILDEMAGEVEAVGELCNKLEVNLSSNKSFADLLVEQGIRL